MKSRKKVIMAVVAAGMISSALTASADDTIKVYVDGEQLNFDVNPVIENDRTLVPMRAIFEALGAEVTWDQDTRTASAVKGDDTVDITIDSNTLYKNGAAVELDVPAKIIDDRTLVPVRAISESFDAEVQWEEETRSVIITNAEQSASPEPDNAGAPSDIAKIQYTEDDIKTLSDKRELIRYSFEQSALPEYVFENSDTIYETVGSYEEFAKAVFGTWNRTATAYALQVGMESETTYEIDVETTDENADDVLVEYFSDVVKAAEVDAETLFEGVTCLESKNGTNLGVVIFKSANSLVQCKYLGIAVSEDGEPRYFTAENDVLDPNVWFFCEVTPEGRGTIATFEKVDEATDFEHFANGAINIYEGNIE